MQQKVYILLKINLFFLFPIGKLVSAAETKIVNKLPILRKQHPI